MALKKLCSKCGKVIDYKMSRCLDCEAKYQKQKKIDYKYYDNNLRDKKSQSFYNSPEWKRIKQAVHIRDKGLCTMCLSENKISYAEVVHHIEPLKENYDKRISTDNLICLCNKHHAYVHAVYGSNNLNKANLQRKLVEMI